MAKSKKKKSAVKSKAQRARVRKLKLQAAEVLRVKTEKNARLLVAHHQEGVHIAAIALDDARVDAEQPKRGFWRTLLGY